jgi:pSer/pThr/pTyr-binding forkhead associated (FHA) protein
LTSNNEIPNAFLIIGGSKVFPINSSITNIGRAYENDLVLEYPQVSRQHAELRYADGHFEIVDLDSTGGTFVNGVRVKNQSLGKGDVITLVNLHLVFGCDEQPDPGKTTQYRKPRDTRTSDQDTIILPTDDS